MSEYKRDFGQHVKSLRRARGMTQDILAERCGLSADTIRRLEHGAFSASMDTLRKLCRGLGLVESTIFESFELGRTNPHRELFDLIASRSDDEIALLSRVVRALIDGFEGALNEGAPSEEK